MPCGCSRNKRVKYTEYNPIKLPLGTRLATNEERSRAPPGIRYPTIHEIKKNPLLFTRK